MPVAAKPQAKAVSTVQAIDLDKLARLTHAHHQRAQAYRSAAAECRRMQAEADALLSDMLTDAGEAGEDAEALLSQPVEAWERLTAEELHHAGLNAYTLRRLLNLRKTAARMNAELQSEARALQDSRSLNERLLAFARDKGELFLP